MGYKQPPHHIYLAYQTLTNELAIPHDEALDRLALTFAGYPVDLIVQAKGDLTMTLAQLTGTQPPIRPDSGKTDKRLAERLLREAVQGQQGSGTGQQQQDGQQGSGNEGQGDDVTFNDLIRARAGRNGKTIELSHDELMGTGQQDGEQSPDSDFNAMLRARTGRG